MNFIVMAGTTMAGKTTHGRLLARALHGIHISSGDIARDLMDGKTEDNFKDGQLSPHDKEIMDAIYDKMFPPAWQYVILDGFPRTSTHLNALNEWTHGQTRMMVWLDVSMETVMSRINRRKRDAFDTEDVARKRHQVFLTTTKKQVIEPIMKDDSWMKLWYVSEIESDERDVSAFLLDSIRGACLK